MKPQSRHVSPNLPSYRFKFEIRTNGQGERSAFQSILGKGLFDIDPASTTPSLLPFPFLRVVPTNVFCALCVARNSTGPHISRLRQHRLSVPDHRYFRQQHHDYIPNTPSLLPSPSLPYSVKKWIARTRQSRKQSLHPSPRSLLRKSR